MISISSPLFYVFVAVSSIAAFRLAPISFHPNASGTTFVGRSRGGRGSESTHFSRYSSFFLAFLHREDSRSLSSTSSSRSWIDLFTNIFFLSESEKENNEERRGTWAAADEQLRKENSTGIVIRCASRPYLNQASKPSSLEYTTRKDEFPFVNLGSNGVSGDYNHYRTTALQSTTDRAVSIVTYDVMEDLRSGSSHFSQIRDGDLGENILIRGVVYSSFFRIGGRYRFRPARTGDDDDGESDNGGSPPTSSSALSSDGVVIEITEPIIPCANLCKLTFINNDALRPMERIDRCNEFLDWLGRDDGRRGWYAKVLDGGGVVRVGDEITTIGDAS